MRAGTLRHRITIQEPSASQDSYGEETPVAWSTLATVWAAFEPLSGDERYIEVADQRLAETRVRFRIRYRDDVTHKMRVSWRSRTFNILEVRNVGGRDREVYLICEELPDG